MSKQVDERVVSMQFDNQHFERNVSTTMSTLDKLKQKLHLPGATKGLEDVDKAAKNVNMSPLGAAVETVQAKFSALQVIGMTALANITNSAVNAGKRIVSALTIDPVKTGFQEYETQINAVQTILANTESKGTTIDDVNKALEELNAYADKTIYNFTEMTRNIGTFTAAGVDLDTSVNAIQGIANLAAVSGSTSQQAATAMYQLSQALSSGTVKLMDWNSVVNAGMGGEVFQNALKETARVHGVAIDDMIESQGSFRETLSEGWLTSEILTETLSKFTMATEGLTEAEIEANRVKLRSLGYTEEQIEEIFKLGNTATNAATKVKTFTQLWDVMKESAQSGWAQSWKIIIGDFEEAKSLLTPLADTFTGFINKMSEARNRILEGVFGNPFAKKFADLFEKLKSVTGAVDNLGTALKALKDPVEVVDSVIRGDWGNTQARWDKLTEAGYDWVKVQNLVNEKLGSSFRRTETVEEAQSELQQTQAKTIEQLLELSDAELENLGFTKDEVAAFRELEEQSRKTGIPIEELIKDINQLSGRNLLIRSFKNIGKMLVDIFSNIKKAWQEIFPPKTEEERIKHIYNLIAAFHKFTTTLNENGETADKIRRIFKGIFALLDIILTVVGGPIKIVFKIVKDLLAAFNIDILEGVACIGDAIVMFRDWIDSVLDFTAIFEKLIPSLKSFIDGIKGWIQGLKETDNIPKYIIDGLVNGLKNGVSVVVDTVVNLAKKLVDAIKNFLGIHSPSTVFFEIGKNIIEGLIQGIKYLASGALELIKNLGSQLVNIFKNIDFGQIIAIVFAGITAALGNKVLNIIAMFAKPLVSVGDMMEDLGDMFEGIGSYFKGAALNQRSKAIKNLAISVLILVGAVLLLTLIDKDKLWGAIGALAVLTVILGGLMTIAKFLGKGTGVASLSLVGLSLALLSIAFALKIISGINAADSLVALDVISQALALLFGVLIGFSLLTKGDIGNNIQSAGKMLTKMAFALLIMVAVIKLASMLDPRDAMRGLTVIGILGGMMAAMVIVSQFAGQHADKAGKMLLKMSFAMLIMVAVVKFASMLRNDEVIRGTIVIGLVGGLFAALMFVSQFAGKNASKAGGMLLMMSLAFIVMAGVIKMVASMSIGDIVKGVTVISLFAGMCAALMFVSKYAGKNATKAGVMMLAISAALLIMTGVVFLLGQINLADLAKGTIAIIILGGIVAGLIAVTKLAKETQGMAGVLTRMIIIIALLAVAVTALSFIEPDRLRNATLAMSLVMGVFAGLIAATNLAKNTESMPKTLLQLLGVTLVLAGVIAALTLVDSSRALVSATALSVLLVAFASAMVLLGHTGIISSTVQKNLLPLLGVVAGLALILGIMSALDVEASIPTAIALGVLLNTMAAALVILSYTGKTSMSAIGAMAVLGLVVAELGLILGLMAHFGVEASIPTAIAMSILLVTMAGILPILAVVGPMATLAMAGVLALMVVVAAIGALIVGIGYLMTEFPQLEEFLNKGIPVLEKIGYAIGSFFGNIIGGFMSGITSGLPEIGTQLSQFMENAQGFITGVSSIDDGFGGKVTALTTGILLLTAADLLKSITDFISGGGGFAQLGSDLSAFMINAMPFIMGANLVDASAMEGVKTLAEIILILTAAELISGITSWISGDSSTALTTFGAQLVPFGEQLVAFSNTVKGNIDSEAVEAAANAGKIMAALANDIPTQGGVMGWLCGEQDLGVFGTQLEAFGKSITAFSAEVKGKIDPEAVEAAANAGMVMSALANDIPTQGGVLGWLCGEQDLGVFGTQIETFGKAMVNFSNAITSNGGIDAEAVESAKYAGETFSALTNGLPSTNWNVWDFLSGGQNLGDFGEQIKLFGQAMVDFSNTVKEGGGIDDAAVISAVNACAMFSAIANAIPATGGISTWWEEISLEDFGEDIVGLGEELSDFNDEVKDINVGKVSAAAIATRYMADAAKIVVESNITEGVLPTFGSDFAGLTGKLYDINGHVKDLNTSKIVGVASMVIPQMAYAAATLNGSGVLGNSGTLPTFGQHFADLTAKLKYANDRAKDISYDNMTKACDTIKTVSTAAANVAAVDAGKVAASAHAIKKIGDMLESISSIDSTSADGFTASLEALGNANVDSFVSAFEGIEEAMITAGGNAVDGFIMGASGKMATVYRIGRDLMSKFITAMNSQGVKAKVVFARIISSCVNAVSGYNGVFMSIGGNLASSFASGIGANAYMAEAKARAMAKAAAKAAEDELDINSPSKVFRKIGTSVPEGFAQGIDKLGNVVTASSTDMAKGAVTTVRDAVSRLADVVDSDIDYQPTIRPVLDLSDVESGASAIGGLLGGNRQLTVDTRSIGAISASMNKLQNGKNSEELLSTMKGLRKDIANMPRNNYNFNGLSYEEGDDVAEALKTIVRAAKMGRRM